MHGLHSTFMLSVVKMLLKGEAGGCALNSHGNHIVEHGKSWKNHGIVILNFCGNPVCYDVALYRPRHIKPDFVTYQQHLLSAA